MDKLMIMKPQILTSNTKHDIPRCKSEADEIKKEKMKIHFAGLGFAAFWIFAAGIDSIVDALLKAF